MPLVKLTLAFLFAHLAIAFYFVLDRAPGTAAALVGFSLDDAWIHMVYARSLAALQGFAYNPGQLETGSSSPLWALALVPATWAARVLGLGIALPAKLTGVLAAVAASLGAACLLRRLGFGLAVVFAAGLAIAVDPALAFAQVSGMEVMLASAVALWAFAALAAERYVAAAILAALAPLARPELAVLALLVLCVAEWRLHKRSAALGARLLLLVPTVGLVGGWLLYCQLVSGYPLPNTFYAKFASRQDFLVHNIALIATQVLPTLPWFARGTGLALWGLGGLVLARRGKLAALVAGFPVVFWLAVAASQLLKEAGPFYWQRYLLPGLPIALATTTVGACNAIDWAWQRRRAAWAPASAVLVALLVLGSIVDLPRALREKSHLFAWNCQNIEELDVATARWLRDHVPANEIVAVTDAGAARYFGERQTIDVLGLNDHRLLHGQRKLDLTRIRTVVAFPSSVALLGSDPAWRPVHRAATGHLTICNCPQSEIVVYQRGESVP
jgi:hypothetical protein